MQTTSFSSHTFWLQSTENIVIETYDLCMNNSDLMWLLLQGYMYQAVQKEHICLHGRNIKTVSDAHCGSL